MLKWAVLIAGMSLGSAASALENVTLQLKGTHAFQFAGYYAAIEQGYYRNVGLDVHIQEARPDSEPVTEVIEGQAQFGVGTSSLVLARAEGKPVILLAVILQHSPYVIYTSQRFNTLREIFDKRIMLEPQAEELLAYLKKEGLTDDPIKRVQRRHNPYDLINGNIDAISGYSSNQPYFFERNQFAYRTHSPRTVGFDFYGDNLFTSEQELQDHPDRVKAFREASLHGWRYAKEHPDEIIDLILRQYSSKHSRDYLRFEAEQTVSLLQPEALEIGSTTQTRWQHITDVFAQTGMLAKDFSLEGFVYDPHSRDHIWLSRGMIITVLLLALSCVIVLFIFRINRKLSFSLQQLALQNNQEQSHNQVLELLASGAPLKEILNALVISVEAHDPEMLCSILLMDSTGRHLNVAAAPSLPDFYSTAINGLVIGPNVGSCGTTAHTGKRTIVEDILTHPAWANFKELAAQAGLGSCWSEPIVSSSGKVLGTFAIYHPKAKFPDEKDLKLIELSAHLAGIAIEKTQAAQELKRNNALLEKISAEVPGIIFQFRLLPDGRSSFPFISQAVRKMYGIAPEDLREDASPFFGFRHPEDADRIAASMKESAANLTPWHIEYRLILPGQGVRWRLGDARPERQEDGSILWHGFITDITDRKNAEERIRHMAQYDALTDLPNRALLSDRLQLALASAKRERDHLALMFLDFDKFKPINDTLGHAIGDVLLKNAAVRMQHCMRESDTIARIGGDEFVVLLPSIDTEQDALLVAEKIRLAIEKPFEIEGHVLNISTSIGIALYPQHGENEIELSKHADLAMYHAKKNGRNRVMIFNYEMPAIDQ